MTDDKTFITKGFYVLRGGDSTEDILSITSLVGTEEAPSPLYPIYYP